MSDERIDDIIKMIDGKMESGVGRLKVSFEEDQPQDVIKEQHHLGRCDIGSPWATGTVSNCDMVDIDISINREKR